MAAPTNLDQYYQKMISVRDQFKAWKNQIRDEVQDLKDVTDAQLGAWGLKAAMVTYESDRITKMKDVNQALRAFDQTSA